jgi:predicted alpha/beta hydrolase
MTTKTRHNSQTPVTGIQPVAVTLTTVDGYKIAALKYSSQVAIKGHLVVAGATGVPQGFYRRFAEYASAQGFTTLTLDYRGIGLSKPVTLKGFRMNYLDWARQDIAAAVEAMASPDKPLFMVGHSYGGHAFGLLPNHHRVTRFYTFATGAGWHGWMPPLERIKVQLMWNIIGPVLTHWKGYLAWSKLGMGEDLPLGVFQQWRHWCRYPRYFFEDPAMPQLAAMFAQVRTPIIAVNALDDLWAPPKSRNAFMQAYSSAQVVMQDIDPKISGPIGHMGYFRPVAKPLWDKVFSWFDEAVASANSSHSSRNS